ncbi:FUSC family protein [Streptomyces sp. CRN 30]|uniref:FUSC family protein n=1 Tax=Streptomyces sp. CRN 30 TaxID=3075613 RepID=UPI002A814663|nr:FUSC family protein [Streptomyces sp. CRN 30]
MSWFRALKETGRSGLTVERKRLEPLVAVRAAAGLSIMIAFGLLAFGPLVAASSAFGAFQAAMATFQRSWRPRPELALVSGTTLAVSTFLGYVTISHLPLFLALLMVWTFLAGLAWAAGPTTGLIASTNVAIMLITVTLPTSVAQAAGHGLMMIAGGLVQAALIVLFPVRRWGAQRDALADALAAEADYARRLRHDPVAGFDPEPLMAARDAARLTARQARTRPAELGGSRLTAERIRPVLASLADPAMGVATVGPARDRVRELLAAAATVLDASASAIRHGREVDVPPAALAALRTPDTGAILQGPPARAATRLGTLLQDVVETAGGSHSDGPRPHARSLQRPSLLGLVPVTLRAMRAELGRDSPITRHAARITAVAVAGYLAGKALPLGHGYWAPLTAVMIMRPDFSQTYSRAVARFGGTLIGIALATGILQVADSGTYLSGALAVLSAGLLYLLMRTGQVAAQACVAAYVVFLLGMGGEAWTQTVPERLLLTLVGGLLAMLAYAVYPAWETPRLRTRLADWLAATGAYAAAVFDRYADPARPADEVRAALLASRGARAAWHTAVARAGDEPVRHRGLSRTAAEEAEDAVAHLGRVAMLLEAHLPDRDALPTPAAARFAGTLNTTTERGARAVRERRVPHWDEVRKALAAWDKEAVRTQDAPEQVTPEQPAPEQAAPGPDAFVRRGAGLLLKALDELSEALDTQVPPMTVNGTGETGGSGGSGGTSSTDGTPKNTDDEPRHPQESATRRHPPDRTASSGPEPRRRQPRQQP